jgi:hypothetical protein
MLKNKPFTSSSPAANGTGAMGLYHQEIAFNKRKRDYISRVHQPMPMLVRGTGEKSGSGNHCRYKKCPSLNIKKEPKMSYATIYQCEEYTVEKKRPFWLCHTTKKIDGMDIVVSCHLRYHSEKEFLKSNSTERRRIPLNNNISSV